MPFSKLQPSLLITSRVPFSKLSAEFTILNKYPRPESENINSEVISMNKIITTFGTGLLIALVLGGTVMVFGAAEVEAQVAPDIDVIAGETVLLDVSPRGTGLGETTVTVVNHALDGTARVRVTIDAPGYQISPQSITVSIPPSSERIITVVVASPLRTPYRTMVAQVHAVQTHFNGCPIPYSCEASTAFFIMTEPYGNVILQSDQPFQRLGPGKEYPFKLKVMNSGNAVDTFTVDVTNKDELRDKGFTISLSSTSTRDTEPHAYDSIMIQVRTPREFGWKNEYFNLEMKATSEVEGRSSDYSIIIWVYGFGVTGFEPIYSIIALGVVGALIMRKQRE